jgi:hypothetical protein
MKKFNYYQYDKYIFVDIGPDDPDYETIKFCKDKGIFRGFDDFTFRPDQTPTRRQLANVVKRMLEVKEVN